MTLPFFYHAILQKSNDYAWWNKMGMAKSSKKFPYFLYTKNATCLFPRLREKINKHIYNIKNLKKNQAQTLKLGGVFNKYHLHHNCFSILVCLNDSIEQSIEFVKIKLLFIVKVRTSIWSVRLHNFIKKFLFRF